MENEEVELVHCGTKEQVANILTKLMHRDSYVCDVEEVIGSVLTQGQTRSVERI